MFGWIWKGLVWVGKLIFHAFVAIVKWAAAHAALAIVVGIGLKYAADYLDEQAWAGAEVLGALVRGFGYGLLAGGGIAMGIWLAKQPATWVIGATKAVGRTVAETPIIGDILGVTDWLWDWMPMVGAGF